MDLGTSFLFIQLIYPENINTKCYCLTLGTLNSIPCNEITRYIRIVWNVLVSPSVRHMCGVAMSSISKSFLGCCHSLESVWFLHLWYTGTKHLFVLIAVSFSCFHTYVLDCFG